MRIQDGANNFKHILLFFLLILSFSGYNLALSGYEEGPIHLSLSGVIVSEEPSSSVAVILDQKNSKTYLLKIGDSLLDYNLIDIHQNRVVFLKNDKIYQVFLSSDFPVNNNIFTLEFFRSDVEDRIQKEHSLIMEKTRLVYHQVNGKVNGIKITKLPEDTILTEIGIQTNDIIKEINGIEMNNVTKLLDLYKKLEYDNQFQAVIERAGKLIRFYYTLK